MIPGDNGEGEHEGLDEGDELDEVVEIEVSPGVTKEFAVLAIIEHNGQDYAMLAPTEQLDDEGDSDLELYLFHYEEHGDDVTLTEIEDEETYEAVREACAELIGVDEE